MLVLKRKVGEWLVVTIGDQTLRIVVSEVNGGHVRLGLCGPDEFVIHRSEVAERIARGEKKPVRRPA